MGKGVVGVGWECRGPKWASRRKTRGQLSVCAVRLDGGHRAFFAGLILFRLQVCYAIGAKDRVGLFLQLQDRTTSGQRFRRSLAW